MVPAAKLLLLVPLMVSLPQVTAYLTDRHIRRLLMREDLEKARDATIPFCGLPHTASRWPAIASLMRVAPENRTLRGVSRHGRICRIP
jgi:hypothetical protein